MTIAISQRFDRFSEEIHFADVIGRSVRMPYQSIEELPDSVRGRLPPHAAEIYRSAFNNAWASYADRGPAREQIAHRVAWAAVKRRYRKADGFWIEY